MTASEFIISKGSDPNGGGRIPVEIVVRWLEEYARVYPILQKL